MIKVNKSRNSIHKIPNDMEFVLKSNKSVFDNWQSLTPLAKNEWICWVISVAKIETRKKHLKRFNEEMIKGKRRPCCWQGCSHR